MSRLNIKKMAAFRLDQQILKTIKEMVAGDPVSFRSQAEIIDAALFHFLSLSKSAQKEILKAYLTKDL